jgi:hypothetical protein
MHREESVSFWCVMARAQAAGHVLIGYYVLPSHIDQPIESTINPQGLAVRCKRRVWNTGDGRLKFLIIRCVCIMLVCASTDSLKASKLLQYGSQYVSKRNTFPEEHVEEEIMIKCQALYVLDWERVHDTCCVASAYERWLVYCTNTAKYGTAQHCTLQYTDTGIGGGGAASIGNTACPDRGCTYTASCIAGAVPCSHMRIAA